MAQAGLAVVSETFVAQQALQFKLREKVFSWTGDSFEIKELNSNVIWFKVKGRKFSLSDRKEFMDAYGNVIASMREPPLRIMHKMEVQGNGFQFEIDQKLKFIGSKAKACVTDLRTKQQHMVYMYGNWRDRSFDIYLGKKKEGGRVIAEARRSYSLQDIFLQAQEYVLTVQPGIDAAMCIMLCIAFDEFNKEDR